MFKKGHHRAPRGCKNHLEELKINQEDIRLLSRMIETLNAQKEALEDQVRHLRSQLGSEDVTEELSVAQIRAQMRRTTPDVVKCAIGEGPTMLLPVGNNRARNVKRRPSWAIN